MQLDLSGTSEMEVQLLQKKILYIVFIMKDCFIMLPFMLIIKMNVRIHLFMRLQSIFLVLFLFQMLFHLMPVQKKQNILCQKELG